MRLFLSVILFLSFCPYLSSQIQHSTAAAQIRRIFNEKTFIPYGQPPEDFARERLAQMEHQTPAPPTYAETEVRSGSETLVSGLNKPESELSAALNPRDSLNLVVAGMTLESNNFFDPVKIPIYFSLDGGQSWRKGDLKPNPLPALNVVIAGGGDPVLSFDKDGNLWITWLLVYVRFGSTPPGRVSLFTAQSSDKGATWSAPMEIAQSAFQADLVGGGYEGSMIDKPWLAFDNGVSTFAGNRYVAYTVTHKGNKSESMTIYVKTQKKGANVFEAEVPAHAEQYDFVHFPSVEVDSRGNVHLLFCAGDASSGALALYHTMSRDGGQSFQPETKIADIYFRGIATGAWNPIKGIDPSRQYPCPQFKISPDNQLFVSWTAAGAMAGDTSTGHNIYFSRSADNGLSWSMPSKINPGNDPATEQYYSTLCTTADNHVALAYYEQNALGGKALTNYVLSISLDAGKSFHAPVVLNELPTDFSQFEGLPNRFGIGEYNQMVCTDKKLFPFWADGRKNNGDLDIYMSCIPLITSSAGGVFFQAIDTRFAVRGPFPNPSFGTLYFEVTLTEPSMLQLHLFDHTGKVFLPAPASEQYPAGRHTLRCHAPSGIWFYQLKSDFGMTAGQVIIDR